MKPAILVTGASGVLGRALLAELAKSGDELICLCRGAGPETSARHRGRLHWLRGDVGQPRLGLSEADYRELAVHTGRIMHLAARTDFYGSRADYRQTNIRGVENVYALARLSGAPLHHVSTAFVCGRSPGRFGEEQLEEQQRFNNLYEESKHEAEIFLRRRIRRDGHPVTIYRPGIILERAPGRGPGKNFGPFIFLETVFRLLLAGQARGQRQLSPLRVRGEERGHLPFVFDDTVAAAILALAGQQDSAGRTFHLVPSIPCPNQVLAETFNLAFGREVVRFARNGHFHRHPATTAEKILARKTRIYAPYLDFSATFDRQNLDDALGVAALPSLEPRELLAAFSRFLEQKRAFPLVSGTQAAVHRGELQEVREYFEDFLPGFFGKPLITNLASLSARFWLDIGGVCCRTLEISRGRLIFVGPGREGTFGYRTGCSDFLDIVRALRTPQESFFSGRVTLHGATREALRTATALEEFFRTFPYPGRAPHASRRSGEASQ